MDTTSTMPVQIVQELLAIYTSRKEATEKLNGPGTDAALAGKLSAAAAQSARFMADLLSELTNYGDAVQSEVDRKNGYQEAYKAALPDLDSMNPEQRSQLWENLEKKLQDFYGEIEATAGELPDSLQQLLAGQRTQLAQ